MSHHPPSHPRATTTPAQPRPQQKQVSHTRAGPSPPPRGSAPIEQRKSTHGRPHALFPGARAPSRATPPPRGARACETTALPPAHLCATRLADKVMNPTRPATPAAKRISQTRVGSTPPTAFPTRTTQQRPRARHALPLWNTLAPRALCAFSAPRREAEELLPRPTPWHRFAPAVPFSVFASA